MDQGKAAYFRWLNGDESGLTEVIETYKDPLILFLNGYVHDFSSAEELCEEVFFRLAVKKPHFAGESAFSTWLFSIGRNLALDLLRKQARHPSAEVPDTVAASEKSVEDILLSEENKRALYRALDTLSPEEKSILTLIYFAGLKPGEAARAMRKSRKQGENLIYRAKQKLKQELTREGIDDEDIR